MKDKVLRRNQKIVKTPIANISIRSEDGETVQFDVLEVTKKGERYLQILKKEYGVEDVSLFQFGVRINTSNLDVKHNYFVECDKKVEFYGSDEFVATYNCIQKNSALLITFPVLNDQGWFEEPSKNVNLDNFEPYYIERFSHKKFLLKINNQRAKYVYFSIAWFENVGDANLEPCQQVAEFANDWFLELAFKALKIER